MQVSIKGLASYNFLTLQGRINFKSNMALCPGADPLLIRQAVNYADTLQMPYTQWFAEAPHFPSNAD
jgi:hypothetical protein